MGDEKRINKQERKKLREKRKNINVPAHGARARLTKGQFARNGANVCV